MKKLVIVYGLLISIVATGVVCADVNYSGTREIYTRSDLKGTADELMTYLNKIDTQTWSVSDGEYANAGIYLGLTESSALSDATKEKLRGMNLEGYFIDAETQSVQIVGNTELAVQHGMFDFLERLGCRFLTPAEAWTVIPQGTGLNIAQDEKFVQPDYISRRIWYANGLGVGHSPDGSLRKIAGTYDTFFRSTRQGAVAPMGFGHSYFDTFLRHQKTFEQHPEWAGMKEDGTRPALNTLEGKESSRNWCYSNLELAELCLQDRIALLTESRKKNPHSILVSMDTNDGARICYCENCKKLGNASDQALTLANYVARGIRKIYPDALVGILIYPPHILPPENIKIEPNILPSMAMGFNNTGLGYDEIIKGWIQAGAKQLDIYEYLGVYEWDYGMPAQGHVTYDYIKQAIPLFYKDWNVRSLNAQSQASWGRYGPSLYVARKLLWDVDADAEKIYTEYFTAAFGKAAPEMRTLFDLWDSHAGGKLTDTNLGRWLMMMQEAVKMSENETPQVKRRIEDMMAYLHTVVLYHKARQAQNIPATTDAEKAASAKVVQENVGELLNFVWRTRERQMMQFWGFMTRMGTFGKEIGSLVWGKWVREEVRNGTAEWMTTNTDYSSQEISVLFENDLKEYRVYLKNAKTFSNKLVPLFPQDSATANSSVGYFMRGESSWYFYIQETSQINITLAGSEKENFFRKAVVTDDQGKIVFSNNPKLYTTPDRTLNKITLNLELGLYHLSVDGGAGTYYPVFTPAVKNVYEQSERISSFNHYFTPGYFYVPADVETLKINNSIFLTLKAPGWNEPQKYLGGDFSIPVGGDGGKVWEIKHVTKSVFTLLNVPPYVATSRENLLVPQELLPEK